MIDIITDIKKEIIKTISTCQKVQEVVSFDKQPTKGFPLVTVVMHSNENVYESNVENMRTFIFRITIYEQISVNLTPPINEWNNAVERAEIVLNTVVSEILEVLDKNYTLNDTVEKTDASPSVWAYNQTEQGWCRTAEILLRVDKSFNIT